MLLPVVETAEILISVICDKKWKIVKNKHCRYLHELVAQISSRLPCLKTELLNYNYLLFVLSLLREASGIDWNSILLCTVQMQNTLSKHNPCIKELII